MPVLHTGKFIKVRYLVSRYSVSAWNSDLYEVLDYQRNNQTFSGEVMSRKYFSCKKVSNRENDKKWQYRGHMPDRKTWFYTKSALMFYVEKWAIHTWKIRVRVKMFEIEPCQTEKPDFTRSLHSTLLFYVEVWAIPIWKLRVGVKVLDIEHTFTLSYSFLVQI